ncbi:unnamed protein product [Amaranthus hypochondriacus]
MSGILFDKKPFVVNPWTPKTSADKASLTTMPIWVKFPGLALEYWSDTTLRKLASTLGPVIRVDNATTKHERMLYARVLVETNVHGEFPDDIYFINEIEELVNQKVLYDWKPIFCGKCKKMGHTEGKCRMGEPRKRVSKPIPRPPKEGKIGATEGEAKEQPNISSSSIQPVSQAHKEPREDAYQPSKAQGRVLVQGTLDPPSKQLQTPCRTTEIYSTNEAGKVVITTIEVNTDPGRRGAPPNS